MRIIWNEAEKSFEAEFTLGDQWSADQTAAKAAGFRTTGPPEWKWYATTVKPLNKLRKKRPDSGLTISPEAFAAYEPMQAVHEKNEAVAKQFKDARLALKKAQAIAAAEKSAETPFDWDAEQVVPPPPPGLIIPQKIVQPLEGKRCIVCADVIAFFERQLPPMCLWCEKITLDKQS